MTDPRRQKLTALLPLALSLLPVGILTMRGEGEAFGIPIRYLGYAMIATCIGLLLTVVVGLSARRPGNQSNSPS